MARKSQDVKIAKGQLTRAQVNDGTFVIPAEKEGQITILDAWVRAIGGASTANTSVDITDGTTIAVSFAQAQLTQNAVLRAGATGATATNLLTALAINTGVKIANVGTAMATATHLDYHVEYAVESHAA